MTMRQFAAVLVVLFAGGVAGGALVSWKMPARVVSEVRAERFLLVDGEGEVRARLLTRNGVPALTFSDSQGNTRISLSLDLDEPMLEFSEADPYRSRAIFCTQDGDAALQLFDEAGSLCVALSAREGRGRCATR